MCLKLFECPAGVDPLYFSTLCVYFYAECQKVIDQAKEKVKRDISVNSMGWRMASRAATHLKIQTSPLNPLNQTNQINQSQVQLALLKKPKSKGQYLGGYAGKVMVGSRHQPICIPAGSCKISSRYGKGSSSQR